MKPTSLPSARWARITRDFWSGVTRAKIDVPGSAARSSSSPIASISAPDSVPATGNPSSAQTVSATLPLSPVTILTVIAERRQPLERSGRVLLRLVAEAEEAERREPLLVGRFSVVAVAGGSARGHTDDALTAAVEPIEQRPGPVRHRSAAGEDLLRRALGDHPRFRRSSPRASTEAIWRSWSKGTRASVRQFPRRRRAAPGAFQSAWSSSFPPTTAPSSIVRLVAHQPEREQLRVRLPGQVERPAKVIRPSVSVPVLSVKNTSTLPSPRSPPAA